MSDLPNPDPYSYEPLERFKNNGFSWEDRHCDENYFWYVFHMIMSWIILHQKSVPILNSKELETDCEKFAKKFVKVLPKDPCKRRENLDILTNELAPKLDRYTFEMKPESRMLNNDMVREKLDSCINI